MVMTFGIAPKQQRRAIHLVDDDVDVSIIIKVAKSAPHASRWGDDGITRLRRNIFKLAIPQVPVEHTRFEVPDILLGSLEFGVDGAIAVEDIQPTIVARVNEAAPPPHEPIVLCHPGLLSYVSELRVTFIMVQARRLSGEVGAKEIKPAIAIVVANTH